MNEQKIEQLKNALREILQLVASRNQPMTEELKQALVQLTDHIANRIQKLRQEESPADSLQPQAKQELEPGPFPSSNVNAFKYDPRSQKLLVKFHGKDTADSGPTYGYSGVPEFIFDVFRRGAIAPKTSGGNKYHQWFKGVTPSLGASMNALIKAGGYQYQRLS